MKQDLREVYLAPSRAAAEAAINVFVEKYGAKYSKAVECLTKDRASLLTFYDFPAEHWEHLKDLFRRHQSQPVDRVVQLINPMLRGWVNYFAIGHASECFNFIKDWVEKKDHEPH